MACEQIRKALAILPDCVETDSGSCFTTHCMYPSFESVRVYVAGYGDGFKVHDDGGALRSIWDHTGGTGAGPRALEHQAAVYGLSVVENSLVAEASSVDWLFAALMSVANASAAAAHEAIGGEHVSVSRENDLKDQIYSVLADTVSEKFISKEYSLVGNSGKVHRFDFAIHGPLDDWLLMDAISPHHVSVAAKFMAFSDIQGVDGGISGRFAIFDRKLHTEDEVLIQTVADLVPVTSLHEGIQRELAH